MCTAATYKTDGFYFGRTLDYEFSYGDEIVVTPRRFPLAFSGGKALSEHFALLGMAHVADGYPLYYDAMNEKGLCMAGLNFVGNAAYAAPRGVGEGINRIECNHTKRRTLFGVDKSAVKENFIARLVPGAFA